MERIHGVSSGAYSSYRVLCLVGTKKDAEKVAAKVRGAADSWHRDAYVESFDMVSADIEQVPVLQMRVNLWDDGTRTDYDSSVRMEWPFDPMSSEIRPMLWRWVRAPVHQNKGGRLEVAGTDHELVKKTFTEKRAQIEAEDAFRLKKEARGRV